MLYYTILYYTILYYAMLYYTTLSESRLQESCIPGHEPNPLLRLGCGNGVKLYSAWGAVMLLMSAYYTIAQYSIA